MGIVASIALGAAGGYGYHKIIGCRSGACPLTANPWTAMIYGAVVGAMMYGWS